MVQSQFLNYVLSNKDFSIILHNNISDEFFSDYKEEYKYIRNHFDTYGVVPDYQTFLTKFQNFDVVTVSEPPEYLVDALFEDKKRREIAKTFNEVRRLLNEGDVKGAESVYVSSLSKVTSVSNFRSSSLFHDAQKRYDKYVEKCNDFGNSYVTTGFPQLDQIMGGFDRTEELATLVGRTGIGKTWALLKCASAAAEQGLIVGLYSGEMSEFKVGYRVDSIISHISNFSITHGNVSVQNEYKKYIDELPNKYRGDIKVLTPEDIGGFATVDTLRAWIEKEHLDMLCVDQHSLLEDIHRAKDPVTRAANISKELKKLQVLKKIPIISACQQNRTSTVDGIDTTHISQSDRIGQDSTTIIFFEQKDNLLTLHLVKSRDSGGDKHLKYAYDYDKGIFEYMPTEKDGLGGAGCDELRDEYESDGEDVF